jgi:hypothetical protein
MKPHRRPRDDRNLDLFGWTPPIRAAPHNDTKPWGSTFRWVPGGWAEVLASGRVLYWSQPDGCDTMEPSDC